MNMIRHMKDKAKKITVVIMAALLCLFTMPSVALADDGGTWVSFVSDGLFNPCVFNFDHYKDGYTIYGGIPSVSPEDEYSFNFSDVNRYRIRIVDQESDSGWVEVSFDVEILGSGIIYHFYFDEPIYGALFVYSLDVPMIYGELLVSTGSFSESDLYVYVESFIPNPPTVSSFLDSGTSVLSWLISTFSSILTFMIANPICFIGLIGSLVGVAFIYIKSTIGT